MTIVWAVEWDDDSGWKLVQFRYPGDDPYKITRAYGARWKPDPRQHRFATEEEALHRLIELTQIEIEEQAAKIKRSRARLNEIYGIVEVSE